MVIPASKLVTKFVSYLTDYLIVEGKNTVVAVVVCQIRKLNTYLPFEHPVFLKRFCFIDISVAGNQRILRI